MMKPSWPGLLLLLGSLGAAAPAAAETRLAYQVWTGGVAVLEAELGYAETDEGYSARIAAWLTGPPSWVSDWQMKATAEGRLRGDEPQPRQYRQVSEGDDRRWLEMDWSGEGPPRVAGEPPPEKERREAISAEQLEDVKDPLSAVWGLLLAAAERGDCDLDARVFDGRRRFDLKVADRGATELAPNRFNHYAGPAQLCEVAFQPLSGYRLNGRDRNNFPTRVLVWLATVEEGLPPVPVRLETEIPYGALVLHLTGAG